MGHQASLAIHKDEFSFSAGHFTIFSAEERETLHGHNYNVSIQFELTILQHGLSFDYRHYKQKIHALCKQLDRHLLLPAHSPYLQIEEEDNYWLATFNHQEMRFLKEDVIILPLTNITIEEMSRWFLEAILLQESALREHGIHGVTVHVYNGPGQSGGASWGVE